VLGVLTDLSGSQRVGVSAVLALFVAGLPLLMWVDEREGAETAARFGACADRCPVTGGVERGPQVSARAPCPVACSRREKPIRTSPNSLAVSTAVTFTKDRQKESKMTKRKRGLRFAPQGER
jgi:hypothetical protein